MPHSVLLVDDQLDFRQLARRMLDSHSCLSVVGEAATGQEALALQPVLKPEVVLLDVQLPDANGFQVACQLLNQAPALLIIMTSAYFDPLHESLASSVGALAYISKKELSAEAIVELLSR